MASGKQKFGIAPHARGIDSIVPVFGYSSESTCSSAALELAKEHIDRITASERGLSEIGTKWSGDHEFLQQHGFATQYFSYCHARASEVSVIWCPRTSSTARVNCGHMILFSQ
jgi:hypothetical protein